MSHGHVMVNGKLAMSGGAELALQLEEKGYDWIKKEVEKNEVSWT